jgi:hypothetical protein
VADQPNKLVILIAGNAGAGKDTLTEALSNGLYHWASLRTDAYAYGIKLVVHQSLGVPWHILNADKAVKESTYVEVAGQPTLTVRETFQRIGEFYRQTFGKLVWASSTRRRAELAPERITIISDARHPEEEIHWMREHCEFAQRVFVVRIRNSRVPVKRGHPSEDHIADEPDSTFDFIVENEGSLDDLDVAAGELANAIVLLAKSGRKKVKRKGDGWGVFNDSGIQVCEPLTSEDDAKVAAQRYDETTATLQPMGPHTVRQMTYHGLGGIACV